MNRSIYSPDGEQRLLDTQNFVQERSSLYEAFVAEREEILRHKWLESEKLGHDIGFERALMDWIRKYRDQWRSARKFKPFQAHF
jgi:hypothetical protein